MFLIKRFQRATKTKDILRINPSSKHTHKPKRTYLLKIKSRNDNIEERSSRFVCNRDDTVSQKFYDHNAKMLVFHCVKRDDALRKVLLLTRKRHRIGDFDDIIKSEIANAIAHTLLQLLVRSRARAADHRELETFTQLWVLFDDVLHGRHLLEVVLFRSELSDRHDRESATSTGAFSCKSDLLFCLLSSEWLATRRVDDFRRLLPQLFDVVARPASVCHHQRCLASTETIKPSKPSVVNKFQLRKNYDGVKNVNKKYNS